MIQTIRILWALAILSVFAENTFAQSFWLHKQLYTNASRSVYRLSAPDTADYVFAQGGFYPARTSDYGQDWSYIFLDTPRYILKPYAIAGFVNPTANLIILGCTDHKGLGHIVRSSDAGRTWADTAIGLPAKSGGTINAVTAIAALDSRHIIALVSANGQWVSDIALLSSDGGISWRTIETPDFSYEPTSSGLPPNPVLAYIPPKTLLVAAIEMHPYSTIYRSTDLGSTWDSGSSVEGTISKFDFITPQVGFAVGAVYDLGTGTATATIDKTIDGGVTWTRIYSSPGVLFSIAFADSIHGISCGDYGLILQTSDGGASWHQMPSDFTIDYQYTDALGDIAYPDTNHAMIASSDGSVLIYQPQGLLSLPNIIYPRFSPDSAPRTFDVTWDPVPNATRYAITVTTSGYPDSETTITALDSEVTDTFYRLSNLIDTSPPPSGGGRQYEIYLQAFDANNESNVARRIFVVLQGSEVVGRPVGPDSMLELYPDPATNWLDVRGFTRPVMIFDALGHPLNCPWKDGRLDISLLPAGNYYVSDGQRRAKFVKQ